MPKNLLIYGGYNWFGFEIFQRLLDENSFTNFIIVDSFQNQLWKDSIKEKFDEYKYLYEENIFLYCIDIKDKYKLEEIYKTFKITHVINNIKYNIYDVYMKEKIDGYQNICELNKKYKVFSYICLRRIISHNSFALNYFNSDFVSIGESFNDCVQKVHKQYHKDMKFQIVDIHDYVYGDKKDSYNDIVYKYKNIIHSKCPTYIHKCKFYLQNDNDLLNMVEDCVLDKSTRNMKVYHYSYLDLYETIYFFLTGDNKYRDKVIHDNKELIEYIQSSS